MNWFLSGLILLVTLSPSIAQPDDWSHSVNVETGTRFIPVELWTGGKWTGEKSLSITRADLIFGKRNDKAITGPTKWINPRLGITHDVYVRTNKGKKQLFTIRDDGEGLGRVYDSRGDRVCEPGFKFPLGVWKQGESRTKTFTCWKPNGLPYLREMKIIIEDIDFTFQGKEHSIRYRWTADGGEKKGLDNVYVYSPGLGNVHLEYR